MQRHIPGYAKICKVCAFSPGEKAEFFTHLEDPGIYTYLCLDTCYHHMLSLGSPNQKKP